MSKKLTPLEALELFCRSYICDLNTLRHREIEEDYFYNPKYKVCLTDIKTGNKGYTADIEKELKAFEIIKKRKLVLYDEMSKSICTKGYIHDIPQEECDLLKEVLYD